MKSLSAVLASLALFLFLASSAPSSSVHAWSSGSGTCYADAATLQEKAGRHPLTTILGFYLDVPIAYEPGRVYDITIKNNNRSLAPASNPAYYNGFLLYAATLSSFTPEAPLNRTRVGTWLPDTTSGQATTAMLNAPDATSTGVCENAPDTTLTHASGGQKPLTTVYKWRAPAKDVGPIEFFGYVEWTGALYYTQVLTPWKICSPSSSTPPCRAFEPFSLPSGSLPAPPAGLTTSPFGLQPVDQSACGDSFVPIPYAAVPAGYCASVYAEGLQRPRGIYVTSYGDLLVLESGGSLPSGVSLLRDINGDGVIDVKGTTTKGEYTRIFTQAGLNHGIYVHGGYLYVSSQSTAWRMPFNSNDPLNPVSVGKPVVVVRGIPGGGHSTRTLLVSPDNQWLYISIGSAGNLDDDDSRSRVIRYDVSTPQSIPDGGYIWNDYFRIDNNIQAFALGLRNEVGIYFDNRRHIYGVMNADDNLDRPDLGGYSIHDDNPAERLDELSEEKAARSTWYGYPWCWAVDILSNHTNGEIFAWGGAEKRDWYLGVHNDTWCRANTEPATYAMQAHTAPLGIYFYDGKGRYAFGSDFYGTAFISLHGSWNAPNPRGYKVITIGFDAQNRALATTQRTFLGYEGPGERGDNRWGYRPVDVKVGSHGEMFVSSDTSPIANSGGAILVVRKLAAAHRPVLAPQFASAGRFYDATGGPTLAAADFSFDRAPAKSSYPAFDWKATSDPSDGLAHSGVASFDGRAQYINCTAADNGAGVALANHTGGTSSYEFWFKPATYTVASSPSLYDNPILFEMSSSLPSTSQPPIAAFSDLFSIGLFNATLNNQLAGLALHMFSQYQAMPVVTTQAIPSGKWTHLVITLAPATGSRSPDPTVLSLYVNGIYQFSFNTALLPKLKHHDHAYLGRSLYSNLPLISGVKMSYFQGEMDAFRIYPYVLTLAQIRANFLSEFTTRIAPIFYGHFAVMPAESVEPTYDFKGVANRMTATASSSVDAVASFPGFSRSLPSPYESPSPASSDASAAADPFPGFVSLNGKTGYVNLSNPNNGIAATLNPTTTVFSTVEFAVEFWIRYNEAPRNNQVILSTDGLITISHPNPTNPNLMRFTISANNVQYTVQQAFPLTIGTWSYIAISASAMNKYDAQISFYLNRQNIGQTTVAGAGVPQTPSWGYLGCSALVSGASTTLSNFVSADIGAFRIYNVSLPEELALYHWATESNAVDEQLLIDDISTSSLFASATSLSIVSVPASLFTFLSPSPSSSSSLISPLTITAFCLSFFASLLFVALFLALRARFTAKRVVAEPTLDRRALITSSS